MRKILTLFYCLTLILSGCSSQTPKIVADGVERVGPSGYGFQHPVWSPDGTRLAVTTQSVVQSWTSEIFVLDVLTGKKKSIMYTDNGNVRAISWSSNGNQILLASQKGGDWAEGIWTLDANGKSPAKFLTEGYDADWSPDGERIAVFSHSEKDAHQDVVLSIINPGIEKKEVVFGGKSINISGGGVAWSPNGAELIFDYGSSEATQLDLYLLNIATRAATRITNEGQNLNPSWGPDGNLIVYMSDPGKEVDSTMYLADKNNNCRQALLTLDDLWGSSWSPDGKNIAFISHGDVYLLNLNEYPSYKSVCP